MFRKVIPALFAACAVGFPALAEDDDRSKASADEVARINEAIAAFNCGPVEEAEKETDNLFELDDASCATGQYDIKLDSSFTVTSMTYDGPLDD